MLPQYLQDRYFELGVLLSCNRALADAKRGHMQLVEQIETEAMLLSDWKITWAGTCAVARATMHLMRNDAKSCLNERLKEELKAEFEHVGRDRDRHKIFWEFLYTERNALLKEYKWSAYKIYLDENGDRLASMGLLNTVLAAKNSELRIEAGAYKGRLALEVLQEAIEWAEDRIVSAVNRAGFDINEQVHFRTWSKKPKTELEDTLLGRASALNSKSD